MKNFFRSRTIQAALLGVIGLIFVTVFFSEKSTAQSGLINTVGQMGGTNVVNNSIPPTQIAITQNGLSKFQTEGMYKGYYLTSFNVSVVPGTPISRVTFYDKNHNDNLQFGHAFVVGGGASLQGVDNNGNLYIQNPVGQYVIFGLSNKPVQTEIGYQIK